MSGKFIATSAMRGTAVAGVRAVATVKRAPAAMTRLSNDTVVVLNRELLSSSVPSRSLTYNVLCIIGLVAGLLATLLAALGTLLAALLAASHDVIVFD